MKPYKIYIPIYNYTIAVYFPKTEMAVKATETSIRNLYNYDVVVGDRCLCMSDTTIRTSIIVLNGAIIKDTITILEYIRHEVHHAAAAVFTSINHTYTKPDEEPFLWLNDWIFKTIISHYKLVP